MRHPALAPALRSLLRGTLAAALAASLGAALACGGTPAPDKAQLTFSVTVPADTPVGATVWVTGNQPELGNWNGAGLALAKGADGKHTGVVSLAPGTALEFKLTQGDWLTVEKAADGSEVPNRTYPVAASARLELSVARWGQATCTPTTTGTIKKHAQVGPGSIAVKARDLIVYLPPGYDANTSVRYPVLYLHDGQNTMDACTSFAGEWHADETAEALIGQGKVAPLILVGVYNTSDRIPDYTEVPDTQYGGGNADAYGRYLVEVVKPLIDATYRTKPEAQFTGVAGSSLGGLVSMYFGLTRSGTFTRIGVLSPSVWWANRDIVTRVNGLASKPAVRVWEDIGTAEDSGDALAGARALHDALKAKGWADDVDLHYLEDAGAKHNEAAWSGRFGAVLQFLYPP
jgi:predicted alpha/beta superfamily hydrolase